MLFSIKKNSLILAACAFLSTGFVVFIHNLTAEIIDEQKSNQRISLINQVFPQSSYDNKPLAHCILVSDPQLGSTDAMPVYIATLNNQPQGMIIEGMAPSAYNGKVRLIVGLDNHNTITGVRVLSHQETPGLGDKIELRISDWILSFTGKTVTNENRGKWHVLKDGGEFDQFTGATITPRAVVLAVRNIADFAIENQQMLYNQTPNCETSYDES